METKINVHELIRQYVEKSTMTEKGAIKDDTLIFDEGLLDSMGLLFLVEFIKDNFDVEADDDELIKENFESINSISSFVNNKLAAKA